MGLKDLLASLPQGAPPEAEVRKWLSAYSANVRVLASRSEGTWVIGPGEFEHKDKPHTDQPDVSLAFLEALGDRLTEARRRDAIKDALGWKPKEPWAVAKKIRVLAGAGVHIHDLAEDIAKLNEEIRAGMLDGAGAGSTIIRRFASPGEVLGVVGLGSNLVSVEAVDIPAACAVAWAHRKADINTHYDLSDHARLDPSLTASRTQPLYGIARWAEFGPPDTGLAQAIVERITFLDHRDWTPWVGKIALGLDVVIRKYPDLFDDARVQAALTKLATTVDIDDWSRAYATRALRSALARVRLVDVGLDEVGLLLPSPDQGLDENVGAGGLRESKRPRDGDSEAQKVKRGLKACVTQNGGKHLLPGGTIRGRSWNHVAPSCGHLAGLGLGKVTTFIGELFKSKGRPVPDASADVVAAIKEAPNW